MIVGGSDIQGYLALPRDLRTVSARAQGAVLLDNDVDFVRSYILGVCEAALLQNVQFIEVAKVNVVALVQDALLSELPPAGAVFMQRRGDVGPEYTSASGATLRGPEALNSERWGQLLNTVEDGVYLLGIGIHSDGASIGNHSQYSCRFSIANIPRELREKSDGLAKFAFAQKPNIRKPRNSQHHERLSSAQKDAKSTIKSRVVAEALVDFDWFARRQRRCASPVSMSTTAIQFHAGHGEVRTDKRHVL